MPDVHSPHLAQSSVRPSMLQAEAHLAKQILLPFHLLQASLCQTSLLCPLEIEEKKQRSVKLHKIPNSLLLTLACFIFKVNNILYFKSCDI